MDDTGGTFEALSTVQPSDRRLDPFWATRLWQKLIKEAMTSVKIGRQRHFLKNYDDVFNGDDLVTVIFNFLKNCKPELDPDRIERSNAVKLCQVLMEKKLFESVVPKGNLKFEDGSSRLYRFIDDNIQETSEKESSEKENRRSVNCDESNSSRKDSFSSPLKTLNTNKTPDCSELSISEGSFKRCPQRRTFRIKTPLMRVRDTKPSPVRFAKRNNRDSDHEASFLELRETCLALLLQLVDIPVLESVLDVPPDLPELPEAPQPFVLANDFTPRKMNLSRQDFRGPVTDIPLVKAASNCLGGGHPPGIANLWSVHACKVLCYKTVVERYSCSAESLIPGEYFSFCLAIVKMLKADEREKALYAMQLLLFHLPWRRRKQLQHLLHFLHLVVDDLFASVDKMVTNYEAVLRDFLPIVFKHPLVSKEPQKILFDFLLLKSELVFRIPPQLYKVKEAGFRICEKIAIEDFDSVTITYTDQCLINLATSVADSTELKLSEKKVWLKRLKKQHPNIYDICRLSE
ncbi:DEP domain-containing protein 7-like [Uloborus diversus]|uniref:DEP domain-containing protein 7-like n=1 Tax=Uloborus diversus TaxID=327109 RepID=UPI002409B039|nr:DEP domain-containing protein 7-like [Uloborus diversus]